MDMAQPSYINDDKEEASEPSTELPKLQKKDTGIDDSEAPEKKAVNASIQNQDEDDDDDDFERDENTTVDAAGSSTESKENKDKEDQENVDDDEDDTKDAKSEP